MLYYKASTAPNLQQYSTWNKQVEETMKKKKWWWKFW